MGYDYWAVTLVFNHPELSILCMSCTKRLQGENLTTLSFSLPGSFLICSNCGGDLDYRNIPNSTVKAYAESFASGLVASLHDIPDREWEDDALADWLSTDAYDSLDGSKQFSGFCSRIGSWQQHPNFTDAMDLFDEVCSRVIHREVQERVAEFFEEQEKNEHEED